MNIKMKLVPATEEQMQQMNLLSPMPTPGEASKIGCDNQGETRSKRGYLPGLNRTLIRYKAHSDVQAPTSSNQSQFKSC